jgi:hypothetical protein
MDKTTIESDSKASVSYWRKWIKAAKKASETHRNDARAAWKEYENCASVQTNNNVVAQATKQSYPIYWASCKTLEPAYYSRTPRITTRRQFDIKDDIALTASILLERLGTYLVDHSDFDAVMQSAVQDFIHADKATVQVAYTAELGETAVRNPLLPQQDPQTGAVVYVDMAGNLYDGEVMQDQEGFFYNTTDTVAQNQRVYVSVCNYDEVLHTPEAKCQEEIRDQAYYFYMTKEEAEKRFGADAVKNIKWKKVKGEDKESQGDEYEESLVDSFVEGWECWDKASKKVYWFTEQNVEDFLDVKDDPYGLVDFFPSCPFVISSRPSKSLYPTSAYAQTASLLKQLHSMTEKVNKLIHGIRRRALVDGANEELIFALESLQSGEFVAITNLQAIIEKGGVQNLVWYLPVQELVSAIMELTQLQSQFKNDFYEWFGLPDILRGASDPIETAAAQELKSASAHDRFKFNKKLVAQLARDAIQKMVDLALGTFTDEYLAEVVGYRYLDMDKQQNYQAAIELLRNDKSRMIRIDIETDTMSFADEQMRHNQISQAVQVITSGLDKIVQMSQTSPQYAIVGLQCLLYSLDAIAVGKEFSSQVKQAVGALLEKLNQPNQAPPPPDYLQMQIQLQAQAQQAQAQQKERELQIREVETNLKAQKQEAELQLQMQSESLRQYQAQVDMQVQRMMIQLEQQKIEIDRYKAQMQARESGMEEMRMAKEVDARIVQDRLSMITPPAPVESTPSVQINIGAEPSPAVIPVPMQMPMGGEDMDEDEMMGEGMDRDEMMGRGGL